MLGITKSEQTELLSKKKPATRRAPNIFGSNNKKIRLSLLRGRDEIIVNILIRNDPF